MTDDQIQTLRKLIEEHEATRTLVRDWPSQETFLGHRLATLRAALALTERRCGNCGHYDETLSARTGWGTCRNPRAHANQNSTQASDGCLLGWVAKP